MHGIAINDAAVCHDNAATASYNLPHHLVHVHDGAQDFASCATEWLTIPPPRGAYRTHRTPLAIRGAYRTFCSGRQRFGQSMTASGPLCKQPPANRQAPRPGARVGARREPAAAGPDRRRGRRDRRAAPQARPQVRTRDMFSSTFHARTRTHAHARTHAQTFMHSRVSKHNGIIASRAKNSHLSCSVSLHNAMILAPVCVCVHIFAPSLFLACAL